MKKNSLLLMATLLATFFVFSISAVSAAPKSSGAITCVLDITFDNYADGSYWLGTVEGDECEVAGSIEFRSVPDEYACPGNTIHFVETFIITPMDEGGGPDGTIEGKNWGVWNLHNGKFRAQGWVTAASENWAHLIGSQYHELGTTSTTDLTVRPITALGSSMKLTPGNRSHNDLTKMTPPLPCFA